MDATTSFSALADALNELTAKADALEERVARCDAVGWGMGTDDLRRKINELKKEVMDLERQGKTNGMAYLQAQEELKAYKKEYAKY